MNSEQAHQQRRAAAVIEQGFACECGRRISSYRPEPGEAKAVLKRVAGLDTAYCPSCAWQTEAARRRPTRSS